jgi:hypothetical protein
MKKLLTTKNVVEWYFYKNALIENVLLEYFSIILLPQMQEYVDRGRSSNPVRSAIPL